MSKGSPQVSPEGLLDGFAESWNDEFCSEHDGTIASFENLGLQLDEITDYRRLFEGEAWDWTGIAKIAAGIIGGATIIAPAAFLAAPGVATALGSWGLLGASGTGTAISSLGGAALTKASLAAIGGGTIASGGAGIAGGTILLSAAGGALGGIRGGVIANGYFGLVKGFDIQELSPGSENVILVNGFLQGSEKVFKDWSDGLEPLLSTRGTYGVTWESKTLFDLGSTLVGASKGSVLDFMAIVAKHAKAKKRPSIGSLGWLDLIVGLLDNPWHTAMAKAGMTGILLAEIMSRTPGKRYTLMGHSLGARVLFYTLTNLASKQNCFVRDVYLLGGAVDRLHEEDWRKAADTVSGKIYNCYSKNDNVLAYLYKGANALLSDPIGYGPIALKHPKMVNVDCTDIVDGHMEYKSNLPRILERIHNQ